MRLKQEYKILFAGSMGAGKTSAIAALSDVAPVQTEVRNTEASPTKATTTVGLDYGEVAMPNGERVRLYGAPGQDRFESVWAILAEGALGVIILVHHGQENSTSDLDRYLTSFETLLRGRGGAIGVTHTDECPERDFGDYHELLERRNLVLPIFSVDTRQKEQVKSLVDALLHLLAAGSDLDDGVATELSAAADRSSPVGEEARSWGRT